ncbi:MAG: nucleotidyltransferase domain-containing protein [DPANN group archaeon]|nr:nucleotidyltransferase domain-containing protein [DPANN group archaeon]
MKAEDKIFYAFYESKEQQLYFNQIKEITKLSNSSLQNALNLLIKDKTLTIDKRKSNTFYKIHNKKLFALHFSKISLKKFQNLNRGIRMPLDNFLTKIEGDIFTIVLFGSASRKAEKKDSDIDILVVSKTKINLDLLKKEIDSLSNYPLNIFQCNISEFKNAEDHVVYQAKNTGFPIKGEQNFFEVVLNEY